MTLLCKAAIAVAGVIIGASPSSADALLTHRIPASLAMEAASETVSVCAGQGYRETAVVLDADGATIVAMRGDGAGIHTLDSAYDKAYTSVSFKNDTMALAERAKGEELNRSAFQAAPRHVLWRRYCHQARRRNDRGHRRKRRTWRQAR